MLDRSVYFQAIIEKGKSKGRVTFIDRQEADRFDVLCGGQFICSLTDDQLKFSTPEHVADMVFSKKEKAQTPTTVKFVEKAIPKKGPERAAGQVKPTRGRPRKIILEEPVRESK